MGKLKPLLIQVPGTDMVATDMVDTMAVATTEDMDILTMEDMDTTVERDLLMPNQKQKLPLIQVPGTDMVVMDMVATMAVATTEDTDIHTEDIMAEVTTGDKSRSLPNLHYHRKISNTAISTS